MMTRLPHWRLRFERFIDELRVNPDIGQWGAGDCLLGLVAPSVLAITGKTKFATYKGKYKTAKGALGVMKRAKFDNLADLVATELREIHPSEANMGDVVAIPSGDDFGYSLGIVNGQRAFVLQSDGRLGTRDMSEAVRAFRVE